jgi:hypothetical protein
MLSHLSVGDKAPPPSGHAAVSNGRQACAQATRNCTVGGPGNADLGGAARRRSPYRLRPLQRRDRGESGGAGCG